MGKRLSQQDMRDTRYFENVACSKAKRKGKKVVGFKHFAYGDGFVAPQPIYENPNKVYDFPKVEKRICKVCFINQEMWEYEELKYALGGKCTTCKACLRQGHKPTYR
jgi:hypothetical protein